MPPDEKAQNARWSRENSRGANSVDFLRRRGKLKEVLERVAGERLTFSGCRKCLIFATRKRVANTQNETAVV